MLAVGDNINAAIDLVADKLRHCASDPLGVGVLPGRFTTKPDGVCRLGMRREPEKLKSGQEIMGKFEAVEFASDTDRVVLMHVMAGCKVKHASIESVLAGEEFVVELGCTLLKPRQQERIN